MTFDKSLASIIIIMVIGFVIKIEIEDDMRLIFNIPLNHENYLAK